MIMELNRLHQKMGLQNYNEHQRRLIYYNSDPNQYQLILLLKRLKILKITILKNKE